MAPTEILANQHFEESKKVFKDFNIEIELLTGSTTLKEKRRIKEKIKTLELYYSDKGVFLADRANKRQARAMNAQLKWEIRISKLLG